jgi:hypothetical protein
MKLNEEQANQLNDWISRPTAFKLLTTENYKISKSKKVGYLTAAINLAPANSSGVMNVCPWAQNCNKEGACLEYSGRNIYYRPKHARIMRTYWYVHDRAGFLDRLNTEIESFIKRAHKKGFTPTIRPNGLSDIPQLAIWIAGKFPNLWVYDYTKRPTNLWGKLPKNYHLLFSYSGSNLSEALTALDKGISVAVVFDTKKRETLPQTLWQVPVIDGDLNDLRFADKAGVVVGLRAKGRLRKQIGINPFVMSADHAELVASL